MKFNESGAALAQDMGAPVTKMQDSIDAHYEASLERSKDLGGPFPACKSWDEASGKKGSGKKLCHNPISGADFAAQPYCVAIITPFIRCGMGGLEIDEDSAVLGSGSQAIRGLYAAGEVAGGVHGNSFGMRCFRTRGRSGSCEEHFGRQSESDIVCGALRCPQIALGTWRCPSWLAGHPKTR